MTRDESARVADADLQVQVSALKHVINAILVAVAEHDDELAEKILRRILRNVPSLLQQANTARMDLPMEPICVELQDLIEEFETTLSR